MKLTVKNIGLNNSKKNIILFNTNKENVYDKHITKQEVFSVNDYRNANFKITTKNLSLLSKSKDFINTSYIWKEDLAELVECEISFQESPESSTRKNWFSIPFKIDTIRKHDGSIAYPSGITNMVEFLINHLYDFNNNKPLFILNENKFKTLGLIIEKYKMDGSSEVCSVHWNYYSGQYMMSHPLIAETNCFYNIRCGSNNDLKIIIKGAPDYKNLTISSDVYSPLSIGWNNFPYLNSKTLTPKEFLQPYIDSNQVEILRVLTPITTGSIYTQGGAAYVVEWDFDGIRKLLPGYVYEIKLK